MISLPGYTTAQLSATRDLTGTRAFVVGDNVTYGGYRNVPLNDDTAYVIYFVVAAAWDGVVKMAFSQLATAVRTAVDRAAPPGRGLSTTTDGPLLSAQSSSINDNDGQANTAATAVIASAVLLVRRGRIR